MAAILPNSISLFPFLSFFVVSFCRNKGCDKQSYGYHGAEGNSFASAGHGQTYGPTFTTGDIIGCCVNFINNTCFYTKNGIDLGIAFRDLPVGNFTEIILQKFLENFLIFFVCLFV